MFVSGNKLALILVSALITILNIGCTTTAITGDVYYRERIALPPGAKITVMLEDVSRADTAATIIGKQEISTEQSEQQVPIGFEIDYKRGDIKPNHRYALRAQIHSADQQLLWATTDHYGVLTHDMPQDNVSLQLVRASQPKISGALNTDERRFAYTCDQQLVLALFTPSQAVVHINGQDLQLKSVPAASGVRYTNERAELWSKGEGAQISLDGQEFSNCHSTPTQLPWAEAKARGIDFRATGNEPGWVLELDADLQIEFIGDYGSYRVVTPVPVPTLDSAKKSSYHAITETHNLLVTIETKSCRDSMSGAQFTQQVRILLDGKAYNGCGKSL